MHAIHEHIYDNLENRVSGTEPEARIVAEKRATWKTPHHVFLLSAIMLCMHALPLWAAESRYVAIVPALGVQAGGKTGVVHYVILQIDKDPLLGGPTVQFNEIHLGGGSIVSEDWKEGVKHAVTAAARAVGVDGRDWVITIKNRSYQASTEGMSASSAIAVGIMAAWRGDDVRSDVALTGTIMPNGQIESVGAIIIKIEAAARAKFKTILVPHGQAETTDGEFYQLATRWNVRIIEVATLEEAYQLMTRPKH